MSRPDAEVCACRMTLQTYLVNVTFLLQHPSAFKFLREPRK